jgi:hypothetical protein
MSKLKIFGLKNTNKGVNVIVYKKNRDTKIKNWTIYHG